MGLTKSALAENDRPGLSSIITVAIKANRWL